jgi:NTP pyrophosphatase (non-canonical NTP hydrolase)
VKDIIQKQKDFQKLLGNDTTTQEFKNMMFLGLFEEVGELMKETPHKLHKKNQTFNRDNFLEECVDVQIYLLNLLISADSDWDEFKKLLNKKQDKNFKRQQEGY